MSGFFFVMVQNNIPHKNQNCVNFFYDWYLPISCQICYANYLKYKNEIIKQIKLEKWLPHWPTVSTLSLSSGRKSYSTHKLYAHNPCYAADIAGRPQYVTVQLPHSCKLIVAWQQLRKTYSLMIAAGVNFHLTLVGLFQYLDFDNLPETNFSCEGKVIGGYYADTETGCQMFHVCTIGQKGTNIGQDTQISAWYAFQQEVVCVWHINWINKIQWLSTF